MSNQSDPRAQRSRERILEAVRTILMTEGAEAITHQRVAEVSGVGRATVYRHWRRADEMVYALIDEEPFRLLDVSADTPLEQRLSDWLDWATSLLADPKRRSVILHILSRSETDVRANRLRMNRAMELVTHLDSAIGNTGSWQRLSQEAKVNGVAILVGPLLMRVMFLATAPTPAQVREAVSNFLVWLERQSTANTTR